MKTNRLLLLEACVETLDQAIAAEKLGAHRLELCERLDLDGLSPHPDLVESVLAQVSLPVRIMIRPKPADFSLKNTHWADLVKEVKRAKSLGVEGMVLGYLDQARWPAVEAIGELAALAYPLKVTFHRAIEQCPDLCEAIQRLIEATPIHSILTSGGGRRPLDSQDTLLTLKKLVIDQELLVCGKITAENLPYIHEQVGASAYHGRKIVGDLPGQGTQSGR
ncbi:MAG: copper homeostasis protein CutC [Bacteroidota bacterium]